jgi:hypothetical protein
VYVLVVIKNNKDITIQNVAFRAREVISTHIAK